jgi:subtilisin family serine protease
VASAARSRARRLARRRALPAAVGAFLCLLLGPSAAQAEEVFTAQARAANATESTWIPAPTTPAAVCIVDTGVDLNPDTTNVIARLAVDGGDPGDVDTIGHHGTLMSMIASAPYNGFGMVGAAPSVKVVSVRAKLPGENGFYFSDVLKGIRICKQSRLT